MRDPQSRRRFLKAGLGLGTVAVAGCGARPPSDGSESDQSGPDRTPTASATRSDPTPTDTDEPSLPELGDDLETDTSGDGIPDLLVERIADEEGLGAVDPYRTNVFVEVDHVEGVDSGEALSFARSTFADAPVENPDGSTGIDVHFVVDEPIPQAGSTAAIQRDYHFGFDGTSVFDRRHRGFRHLVVFDDLSAGWYADPFVLAVESGRGGRLVDALAAHLAGRFDPLVAAGATTESDRLWLPGAEDATAAQLLDAIDWDLVARNLPKAAPSTRWYERKYAHLPPDSDVPPPDATEEDLGPAVGDPEKDTSGDGIPDRLLVNADVFEGADPLRKNVFVEVDYERGVPRETVEQRMREIQTVFADAPVRNPDGSMGIDVHYVVSDELAIDGQITREDADTFRTEHFDRLLEGYFYMMFVEDFAEVAGVATQSGNILFAEPSASTALHELGHALGLYPIRPGVDQRRYPFTEYPSVMNYNAPRHALVFADDTAHPEAPNDWAIIERLLPDEQPPMSLL